MPWLAALLALLLGCGGDRSRGPAVGLLDHQPHHGGVVMAGPRIVIEARAWPDGGVKVWLGDGWRRPLPLQGARGTARLLAPDGPREVPLEVDHDALAGQTAPIDAPSVGAAITVVGPGGETVTVDMVLPLRPDAPGGAGVPLGGCRPPPPGRPGSTRPRCVITFDDGVAGLVATPAGDAVVVAVLERPTSSWRLPEATLLAGFGAPPPEHVQDREPPHVGEPTAMAASPDGREVALVHDRRVLRYAIATGRAVKVLEVPGGPLRTVAWPARDRLLVGRFGAHEVLLLSAEDGTVVRALPLGDEVVTTVAASADGRFAAAGTESGAVVVLDLAGAAAPNTLAGGSLPLEAVGFAGTRLVGAGGDTTLRIWDAASGTLEAAVPVGGALTRLAVAPGGRQVATCDREAHVRIHAVPGGAVTRTIDWHAGHVRALAWAGDLLLAGDADRQLAVWELPATPAALQAGTPDGRGMP